MSSTHRDSSLYPFHDKLIDFFFCILSSMALVNSTSDYVDQVILRLIHHFVFNGTCQFNLRICRPGYIGSHTPFCFQWHLSIQPQNMSTRLYCVSYTILSSMALVNSTSDYVDQVILHLLHHFAFNGTYQFNLRLCQPGYIWSLTPLIKEHQKFS
jgi:hypothetical protein